MSKIIIINNSKLSDREAVREASNNRPWKTNAKRDGNTITISDCTEEELKERYCKECGQPLWNRKVEVRTWDEN